jgi:hypothetical protein
VLLSVRFDLLAVFDAFCFLWASILSEGGTVFLVVISPFTHKPILTGSVGVSVNV